MQIIAEFATVIKGFAELLGVFDENELTCVRENVKVLNAG